MDVRGGPWWSRIHPEIGSASIPLYDALFDRVEARLLAGHHDVYELDELDWTAIRCLVPVVLEKHTDRDFHLSTGYSFDDLRGLGERAVDQVRAAGSVGGGISYQIGPCVVSLPVRRIWRKVFLAAAPDESSWDRVVPECARGRREEFIPAPRRHWEQRSGERRWVDIPAESLDDLYRHLAEQAEPWEHEAVERTRGDTGPGSPG
jgi:hypothetical protein